MEEGTRNHGTPDHIKQPIRKLIEIQSLGGQVLLEAGDVCRPADVRRALEAGLKKFGSINGVIHAAGVLDDGPLQVKSRENAARVLDPKVKGTLVLDQVLRDLDEYEAGDFPGLYRVVFLRELRTGTRRPGGLHRSECIPRSFAVSQAGARVVAINWGPWRDVGMAARTSSAHPLLGRRLVDTADEIAYSTPLSCQTTLGARRAPHQPTGKAVFPGTGYLEMASAALLRGSFDRGVEFEDVFFLAPLLADPGEIQGSPGRAAPRK